MNKSTLCKTFQQWRYFRTLLLQIFYPRTVDVYIEEQSRCINILQYLYIILWYLPVKTFWIIENSLKLNSFNLSLIDIELTFVNYKYRLKILKFNLNLNLTLSKIESILCVPLFFGLILTWSMFSTNLWSVDLVWLNPEREKYSTMKKIINKIQIQILYVVNKIATFYIFLESI